MIRFDTETCELKITGTTIDLGIETIGIIRAIYKSIKNTNEECGEKYKDMIIKSINDAFLSDEELHESTEMLKRNSIKILQEMIDMLKKDNNIKDADGNSSIDTSNFNDKEFLKWLHKEE